MRGKKRVQETPDSGMQEEAAENSNDDDEKFLRRSVAFMTQQQLQDLESGNLLGAGAFGSVRRVVYEGKDAVVKEFFERVELLPMLHEARVMVELDGAGGVPRLLAVCPRPPALVQVFVGQTYDTFLLRCSVAGFLDSLVSICRRLLEIHDRGFVHNDVKTDNVTFNGSVLEPVFHLIDVGLCCRFGSVAGKWLFRDKCGSERETSGSNGDAAQRSHTGDISCAATSDKHCNASEDCRSCCSTWMAPEVRFGRPVFPSGDVYSFGFLVRFVLSHCKQGFLTESLGEVPELCIRRHSRHRPCLTHVTQIIASLRDRLSPQQLLEPLNFLSLFE